MLNNIRDIILFLNICRISNLKIINLISEGFIEKFLDLNKLNVSKFSFLSDKERRIIIDKIDNLDISKEKNKLYKLNIKYVTILDDNYPKRLKNIFNPPAIIYFKGNYLDNFSNILAIVGTRKPSNYGLWVTNEIIKQLSKYNISIVSGMALGIDRKVHESSIAYNIPTIGVLASSADIIYPIRNKDLYYEMKNQLLISEFPLNTNPIKRNFVSRNRIISGLAFGTLVIEAQDRSGSLITANYALEQSRELYAIPGNINNINSHGTNMLIKKGAKLVSSAEDIIEEIGFISEVNKINISNTDEISKTLDKNSNLIFELLSSNILSVNDLANQTNLDIDIIYEILLKLEELNFIEELSNGNYTIIK